MKKGLKHFSSSKCQKIASNGLRIGEEWEFEIQMLISVPKFNSSRMLKYSTSAHFLPIPCYMPLWVFSNDFSNLKNIK
jgi:hypothetical protein